MEQFAVVAAPFFIKLKGRVLEKFSVFLIKKCCYREDDMKLYTDMMSIDAASDILGWKYD